MREKVPKVKTLAEMQALRREILWDGRGEVELDAEDIFEACEGGLGKEKRMLMLAGGSCRAYFEPSAGLSVMAL